MKAFEKLNIAVAGTGYVGLSIAVLLSQHHHVTAVDIVPEKVEPETPEETADSSLTDEEAPQAAPAEDTTPEEIPLTDPARMTANEDENPM